MSMTPEKLHIMRHALGLERSATSYRNHFVAGEGHADMPDILALVDAGFMAEATRPPILDESDCVFYVTPAGREIAQAAKLEGEEAGE